LGCYGYARETSPAIDAFAKKSILFESCISQATSTLPSHASIFTSLYPPAHGVINNVSRLAPSVPSLIRVFRDNGFATGAVISNVVLESQFGLRQGFQTYDETLESHELNRRNFSERRADAATDAAVEWLQGKEGKRFFLWTHYIDPHGAYHPPPEYQEMFLNDDLYSEGEELPISAEDFVPNTIPQYQALFENKNPSYYIAQYDGEIRFTDDQIGRLFQFLERSGLMSNTIVIVTADHGETFTERDLCFTHTFRTYDEQAVIPLIIHFPDLGSAKRIDEQVRAIDIMPTLLDRLGLENPYPIHGTSLMRLITSGEKPPAEFAVTYSDHGIEFLDSVIGAQKSIRTLRWKLTRNSRDGSRELYNLLEDPFEKNNLAQVEPVVLNAMGKLFDDWEKGIERATVRKPRLSPEQIEQLKSLGYFAE
jgi:arylsulfatase A-like enzyme